MTFGAQNHHRRSTRLKGYDYTLSGAYFVTLVTFRRDPIFGEIVDGQMKLSALGQIVREEWLRSIGIRKEIRLYADEFVVMPNHFHGVVWIVGADGVRPGAGVTPDMGVNHDAGPQSNGEDNFGARDGRTPCAPTNAPLPVGADGVRPGAGEHLDPGVGLDAGPQSNGGEDVGARRGRTPCAPTEAGGILVGAVGDRPDTDARSNPALISKSLGSFISGFKASVTGRARRELGIEGIWQRSYYDHIVRGEQDLIAIRHYIDANPLRWQDDQLHPAAPPNPFNQE